jgi:hypothetical protein
VSVDAWLTPDTPESEGSDCRPLFIPHSEDFRACVEGALLLLIDPNNWETFGTMTAEEAAGAAYAMYRVFTQRESCMPIGAIVFMASNDIPDYLLVCDGSEVPISDYPLLAVALGDTWGVATEGYVKLPDMIDTVAYGAASAGGEVGENAIALNVSQLPAHNHSVHSHLEFFALTGEEPVSMPGIVGGTTGSTGGGESIDIRQAGVNLIPCIVSR